MTNNSHEFDSTDARRRQIRVMQAIFAGAATATTLALFSAGPGDAETAVASGLVRLVDQAADLPVPATAPSGPQTPPRAGNGGSAGTSVIAVNDDDDTNPSSGDIFQQNAEDQSTA